ncbi:uncharacterized protein LOC128984291 [Macrosteles quadrilineatus]|uniref:uncharacterized protein LOC128984291 n=1 Tax=Macrosteles quadrilineatus TaxID=74068 RepID=UPI0023E1DD5B|nr:uncharacterized protein LOC128984291 [Macrosteles quadrilineatus]
MEEVVKTFPPNIIAEARMKTAQVFVFVWMNVCTMTEHSEVNVDQDVAGITNNPDTSTTAIGPIQPDSVDREFSKPSFLTQFIEMYQSLPCLWQVSSKDYSNNIAKRNAYDQMTQLCIKVNPNANVDWVKKKIKSIRTVFRKEVKKVEGSKKSGAGVDSIYVPKLWYYDKLMFTLDETVPRQSLSSIEIEAEPDPDDPSTPVDPSTNEENGATEAEPTKIQEDIETRKCSGLKPAGKKRQQKINDAIEKKRLQQQEEALGLAMDVLKKPKTSDMDEFSAIGFTVSNKLKNMENGQRLLSELLINKVLYFGMTGQLTESTDVSLNKQAYGNFERVNYGDNRRGDFHRGFSHSPSPSSYLSAGSSYLSSGSANPLPSDTDSELGTYWNMQ